MVSFRILGMEKQNKVRVLDLGSKSVKRIPKMFLIKRYEMGLVQIENVDALYQSI